MNATSLPLSPRMKSLPVPPISVSGALAAEDRVVARAAVDRQPDDAGRERRRGDGVVAALAVDDERIVRALGAGGRDHSPAVPATVNDVPPPTTSTASAPLVPFAITVSAAPSPAAPPIVLARLIATWVDVGSAQVVDADRVGAAEAR
jgi:hypothetical protein